MKIVNPKIMVIAATAIDQVGLQEFLDTLGVPDWDSPDVKSDAEMLIEVAGKNCYQSFSTDLNKNLTRVNARNNQQYIQEGLISTKHGSVLEHATVTFAALNVSRIMTHELVRHRVGAAYSQESGRYVRTDELCMYIPPEIMENEELLMAAINAGDIIHQQYKLLEKISGVNEMTNFDLKKKMTSALRRWLPNGQANSIIFTYNHRTLRQTIEARTSVHAEEEIRVAFYDVYIEMAERFPAIYADATVTKHKDFGRAPEVTFAHSKI